MKRNLFGVTLLLSLLVSVSAWAQPYPNKPIRFTIGFPPGTVLDAVARLAGNEMEKQLGQPIVLEFKTGANGTIAAKAVVNAPPDGYTLFYGNTTSIHPIFNRNNAVFAGKELLPIARFATSPFVFFSSAKLPAGSFPELLAYAKANPDRLTFGSPNPTFALIMQMLKDRTGFSARVIPYKGSPQIVVALLAGEADLAFSNVQPYLPHIQAGKIRALFVAGDKRSPLLPNVPTADEVRIANFELATNQGLWAPLGTPREIIQKLNAAAASALKVPAVAEQIRKGSAAEPVGGTPEDLLRTFEYETKLYSEAAKASNFQPQ